MNAAIFRFFFYFNA
ncbi:pheST operon leader peptide PheM [Cronobacter malonaticus]|nr:pheST operon leader peptide PheM [Cronobacter malonaticus]